jgi:phosphoglycerol transferase
LPEWVANTTGFSIREDWGRWTDGTVAKEATVSFTRTFSSPLCVEFTGAPSASLLGKQLGVRLGDETEYVALVTKDYTPYSVTFSNTQSANKIAFVYPYRLPRLKDVDKSTTEARRLGLALLDLKILQGSCSAGSSAPPSQ